MRILKRTQQRSQQRKRKQILMKKHQLKRKQEKQEKQEQRQLRAQQKLQVQQQLQEQQKLSCSQKQYQQILLLQERQKQILQAQDLQPHYKILRLQKRQQKQMLCLHQLNPATEPMRAKVRALIQKEMQMKPHFQVNTLYSNFTYIFARGTNLCVLDISPAHREEVISALCTGQNTTVSNPIVLLWYDKCVIVCHKETNRRITFALSSFIELY